MVRRMLALLALHPTQVVSREEIAAALWDDHPPSSAPSLIHGYASRLRKQLPGGSAGAGRAWSPVIAERGGYRLGIDPEAVDLTRFTRLIAEGYRLVHEGEIEAAIDRYAQALGCWRGPLLADLESHFQLLPVAVTAAQARVTAVIEYARCCVAAGRPSAALGSIGDVARLEPLHEGLHTQLLIAQSGAGDRAGAVETYAALRRRLADELGLDPGDELQSAYLQMLREGDPAPAGAAPSVPQADRPASLASGDSSIVVARAVSDRRQWPWRQTAAAALIAVMTVAGGLCLRVLPDREPPRAAAAGSTPSSRSAGIKPGGRTFTPQRSGGWVYGPVLGESPRYDQWFSATVRQLGDHDHLAGVRLRFNGDPEAENDNAGVLVAVCATGYEIEAADPDFVHEDTPLPTEGRLLVTLSADNLLTIAFDDRIVVSRRLLGRYRAGRQIIPAAWQLTTGVSMIDIRSNTAPDRIAPAEPVSGPSYGGRGRR